MSEICLDCYNKQFGTHLTEKDVKLEIDLCEDCGQIKPTIVVFRCRSLKDWLTRINCRLEDYAWGYRYRQWRKEAQKAKKGGPKEK